MGKRNAVPKRVWSRTASRWVRLTRRKKSAPTTLGAGKCRLPAWASVVVHRRSSFVNVIGRTLDATSMTVLTSPIHPPRLISIQHQHLRAKRPGNAMASFASPRHSWARKPRSAMAGGLRLAAPYRSDRISPKYVPCLKRMGPHMSTFAQCWVWDPQVVKTAQLSTKSPQGRKQRP